MNSITELTKPEELLKEYSGYRNVLGEGKTLIDSPWIWNRLAPLFYECPYGSKVLDIGTNAGDFLDVLEKDRGCEAYGIDISESCVKEGLEKGRKIQLSDGHKLPFPDQTFDAVFLNEVLIHVYSPEDVLREAKRVLKTNGILLGSTPHKNLEEKVWEEPFSHHEYYNQQELKELLTSVFPKVYLKTLNGAQFSFTMAQSSVGSDAAEILFKAGGEDTEGFEAILKDKSVLRVWMGFTQPPGDVYYRMSGYADKMRDLGAEIAYEPFDHSDLSSPGDWERKVRWKHVQHQFEALLKCADFSIWQIVHSMDSIAFLKCIKDLFKKPIITEIDDWIFDVPSSNLASGPYHPNSDAEWVAYKQIELSDQLIVSTNFLKEGLNELFPDKPINVIPNSIDFKLWQEAKPFEVIHKKKEGVVRLTYNGCGNHNADVEIIKKPLLALLDEFPNVEVVFPLRFESYSDVSHERFLFVNKWLPLPQYPGMMKGLESDIGLAPLRDNNLNRAKSNLRWLEYSVLKNPCVMSKVKPFQECVVNGISGYLCNSQKDWYERLKSLIQSESERKRIGENAYHEVHGSFNMDIVSQQYLTFLKRIKKESL